MRTRLALVDLVIATALTLGAFSLAWQRVVPDVVGIYNDDGVYVVTAKALATGHGYRLLHLPGEPFQTKYPPLFPALLASVWWLVPAFPDNVIVMKAVCTGLASLACGGLYLLLLRFGYANRWAALVGVGAGFFSPKMMYYVSTTLSETLFLPLLVVSVWLAERIAEAERRPGLGAAVIGGTALAALALARSAGVFVAAGVLASLLFRRRLHLAYLVAALVPIGAWHAYAHVMASAPALLQDAYNVDYVSWWHRLVVEAPWQVITINLAALVVGMSSLLFDGLTGEASIPARVVPLAFVLSLVAWAFVLIAIRRRATRPLVLALVAYLAGVVCWPWQPLRFLVIVMPVLLTLMLDSASAVPGTKAARRGVFVVVTAALVVVLVSGAYASVRVGYAARATGYPVRYLSDPRVDWARFAEAFEAVERRTPRDAVVASVVDPMVYLYATRKAQFAYEMDSIALFYRGDEGWMTPERLAAYWRERRVTHVLRMPIATWRYAGLDRAIEQLKRDRSAEYAVAWRSADDAFELLSVSAPESASPGQAGH